LRSSFEGKAAAILKRIGWWQKGIIRLLVDKPELYGLKSSKVIK
jgi:hypothetical protein